MVLITILFIFGFSFLALACLFWIKLMAILFEPFKSKTKPLPVVAVNPYVAAHKIKIRNDRNYKIYLEWLQKNGADIPFNKVMTPEEEAQNQINNLMK